MKSALSLFLAGLLFCVIGLPVSSSIAMADATEALPATEKIPFWVNKLPFDASVTATPDQEAIRNGIYYALLDTQVMVQQDKPTQFFYHDVEHMINTQGVEKDSQLQIGFDPHYQKIVMHELAIWRDNKRIDKLPSAKFSVLHAESEQDDLIYSDKRQLNIILNDVRVGDSIEYSYSRIGTNPLFKNSFSFSQSLSWSVPVGSELLRIVWKKNNPLFYKVRKTNATVEEKTIAGHREYVIRIENPPIVQIEDDVPAWFSPWGSVDFSELDSWEAVVNKSLPLYGDAIDQSSEIKTLANELVQNKTTTEEKIKAILGFVQEDIRYLGIEISENAYRPRIASETLKQRYGDCKDKVVLTISLLKAIGIDSYPALVNTQLRQETEKSLPSMALFDHVIVYLESNGKTYWLDPTRKFQFGSLDQVYESNYGFGLILRPNEKSLTAMNVVDVENEYDVVDSYDLSSNDKKNVFFESTSTYSGLNAETERDSLGSNGLAKTQKDFIDFFKGYYSDMEPVKSVEFVDDTGSNKLMANEKYIIRNLWEDNAEKRQHTATFYENAILKYIKKPENISRTQPFKIFYPVNVKQEINIQLGKENWKLEPEEFKEENPFFNYKMSVRFDKAKNLLNLTYAYKSLKRYIEPEQYAEYISALDRVSKVKNYEIYVSYDAAVPPPPVVEKTIWDKINWIYLAIGVQTFFFIWVLLLWWRAERRYPADLNTLFYPVSLVKFTILWMMTFGAYAWYWFYKNWKYIKVHNGSSIRPLARAIFYFIFFYWFYLELKKDSATRNLTGHLPNQVTAGLFAVLLIGLSFVMKLDYMTFPALLLSIGIVLPLANYINHIAGENSEAYVLNSKWGFRHYLWMLIAIPIWFYILGSDIGFLPGNKIVPGNRLLSQDIKFMQREGVLRPDDTVQYFYSDAFLFMRNDGNGFTDRHVFSYWRDANNQFSYNVAEYQDIKDIKVTFSTSQLKNTIIEIIKNDDSHFMLYASTTDKKDEVFVSEIRKRWNKARDVDKNNLHIMERQQE